MRLCRVSTATMSGVMMAEFWHAVDWMLGAITLKHTAMVLHSSARMHIGHALTIYVGGNHDW